MKNKKDRGRPKKTIPEMIAKNELPKNWKEKIMGLKKEGASDVEVRAELGISQDLWDRFKKEIEEFSLTIKKGDDLCEAWWEKKGRTNLENRQFNAVLWYMNMKNRFGWKDRNEVSGQLPIQSSTFNIFLTKNERIIKIVQKAQNELRDALSEEITEK